MATRDDSMAHNVAPAWFQDALDEPFEDRWIEVNGARIHYLYWSRDEALPGLLLIHGNGAHAHWWQFIAPFFLEDYRVAAIDLSGMGDSDHRDQYTPDLFAEEAIAVIRDAEFEDAIIIGHSFGGFVTTQTALRYSDELRGVVLVDSPVRPPDYEWERDPRRAPIRPKRIYPDFASAAERFRLMPPQECENAFIVDFIARHSITETDGGWTWKFDDGLFNKMKFSQADDERAEALRRLPCRAAVIYGDQSALVDQPVVDFMYSVLDESVPFMGIPLSYHHVFLDQPLPFVAAVRMLLAEWRHSRPNRNPPAMGQD